MGRYRGGFDAGDIDLKDVNFKNVPRLKEFVIPFKRYLLAALILAISISLLSTVGPLLVRRAIDQDIPAGDAEALARTALTYILVMVFIEVLRFSQQYIMSWTGQNMLYSMRRRLFLHLQDLGLDFYDKVAGRTHNVPGDKRCGIAEQKTISSGVLGMLSDLVTLVAIMVIMVSMNVKLAMVTRQ